MDCKVASKLMMLYIDSSISTEDLENLKKHTISCQACREEFLEYESVLDNIDLDMSSEINYIVPNDFEYNIMKSIECIENKQVSEETILDKMLWFSWSFLSSVIGIVFIMISYRNSLVQYFGESIFSDIINAVAYNVEEFYISINFSSVVNTFNMYFNNYKYYVMIILCIAIVSKNYFTNNSVKQVN